MSQYLTSGISTSALTTDSSARHQRRRSSTNKSRPPALSNIAIGRSSVELGKTETRSTTTTLSPVPGTPADHMSFSRDPSPRSGGGWSSPGLTTPDNRPSMSGRTPSSSSGGATWESAKAKTDDINGGYLSFSTSNNGFFHRHMRQLSNSLPHFNRGDERLFAERGKLGRARSKWFPKIPTWGRIRRTRKRYLLVLLCALFYIMFLSTPLKYHWRRSLKLGGGKKFVIILAANQGGGVMEWKGPREWAIERDSVRNKRKYVAKWGYDLEIVDMSTKKRYAHEWRESWEKVDTIRNCLKKYPDAEWFWWLDLNTFIMEPSYSLQEHIFNDLSANTYRDINEYNPLNISHPFTAAYLDPEALSAEGDGRASSINLVIPQDCSGFNLGSFFVRRSDWTLRLLDIWWDPVGYEQKHMEWEHKEQDALEFLYTNQPWIRPHTAFIPQRMINSFPPGACSDAAAGNDSNIHYDERDRDFVVNMAGCEWGRDCWGEMYNYRELSNFLNRTWWERFKEDLVAKLIFKLTGKQLRL